MTKSVTYKMGNAHSGSIFSLANTNDDECILFADAWIGSCRCQPHVWRFHAGTRTEVYGVLCKMSVLLKDNERHAVRVLSSLTVKLFGGTNQGYYSSDTMLGWLTLDGVDHGV
jgi:hypothetical protein